MPENSTHGKLGLMAGALSALALPLFKIDVQKLANLEYTVLTVTFAAALIACSLVASRRLWLGLLVLPPVFFGLMCLVSWWITTR
jgi:hypothetical protein